MVDFLIIGSGGARWSRPIPKDIDETAAYSRNRQDRRFDGNVRRCLWIPDHHYRRFGVKDSEDAGAVTSTRLSATTPGQAPHHSVGFPEGGTANGHLPERGIN
jgi:hypothetical protein